MSYRFQKLTPENIHDLKSIYLDAFGKEISVERLDAKFNTKFAGVSYVGFIAYHESGEPAAFYGSFPCYADYNSEKYLIAQSGDTMTHSKHRGKGLFTQLAKETFEYCRQNGFHLIFGFPNQNSYPGFVKKLDWIHFDNLDAYLVRVNSMIGHRIKKQKTSSKKIDLEKCKQIMCELPKSKAFSSSCLDADIPVIDHSQEFCDYKQYEDNYLVEIDGIGVWLKLTDNYLLIGDIEKATEEKWYKVLQSLKKIAKQMGVLYIRFNSSTNVPLLKFFSKYGRKMEVQYAIAGLQFTDAVPMERMKFTAADIDIF